MIDLSIISTDIHIYLFFIGSLFLCYRFFDEKKIIKSMVSLTLGLLWILYYRSVYMFINELGADSFAETTGFALHEAIFWMKSLSETLRIQITWWHLCVYTGLGVIALRLALWLTLKLHFTRSFRYGFFTGIGLMLMGGNLFISSSKTLALYARNSDIFLNTKERFTHHAPPVSLRDPHPLDLVVYIGESTSSLNWGIYGYIRNTTPQLQQILDEDAGFMRFKEVVSTHTHTSFSLLEALSFGISGDETLIQPVNERKRMSMIDVLTQAQLTPYLYSNQGATGSWNQASSIVFAKANRVFSTESRHLGNGDGSLNKPFDHEFLLPNLENHLQQQSPAPKQLTVLHSYAGHGAYLANIPKAWHNPVDDLLRNLTKTAIVGPKAIDIDQIEHYDSAMAYIDHNLAQAIGLVKKATKPVIFVYFADHGDAVYAGRGHDSARFIHEMIRIPFLMYFNEAAQKQYPDLFAKYKTLAQSGQRATLAQWPSTAFDLLSLEPQGQKLALTPVIGEPTSFPPLVVRQTSSGTVLVDINQHKEEGAEYRTKEIYTDLWAASLGQPKCYQVAPHLGALLRGSITVPCLSLIIKGDQDGPIYVGSNTSKLPLSVVLEIAKRREIKLLLYKEPQLECDKLISALTPALLDRVVIVVPESHGPNASHCVSLLNSHHIKGQLGSPSIPGCNLDEEKCVPFDRNLEN